MPERVVITGRGVVTPVGEGAEEFFDALCLRRSGIESGLARCADFDPTAWMTGKEARRADRFTQFAVAASEQAAADAGLAEGVDPGRLAVLIGTGVGGLVTLDRQFRAFVERGARAVSPQFVPMMMPNAAAGTVAMRLDARGPGFSVASACATGAHALGEAKRMIERGDADAVVAGGSEAPLVELCIEAFRAMRALSRRGVSCPFDARRDGFVMSEGAAVMVLESERHARARGARVRGILAGYGATNDAFHMTQPDSHGRGASAAMAAALLDAGADSDHVGYINAHGTSTPFNDRIECAAIESVFGERKPPASSIKSAIGHSLGGSGAIEAVATLMAVERGVLPPTLNYEDPDPECDIDCVPDGPREVAGLGLALSNSFGFGGQNATLAIGSVDGPTARADSPAVPR